jgi:hypothetical protein
LPVVVVVVVVVVLVLAVDWQAGSTIAARRDHAKWELRGSRV